MRSDLFEWDDATQSIVEKAVESRELDRSAESLKDQADNSLDVNFNQYNWKEVLQKRENVVKSVQQNLGPHIDAFNERDEEIGDIVGSDRFERNKSNNAHDRETVEALLENYRLLKRIHSLTVIWAYLAHANSSDVAEAVEIRQMQAEQNKAMEMVSENYDKFVEAADKIGRQVKQGQKEALKEVLSEREDRIDELESELSEKEDRIDELESASDEVEGSVVDVNSLETLSKNQQAIYDFVLENPGASDEEISEETDTAINQVPLQLDRIENRGWPLPER